MKRSDATLGLLAAEHAAFIAVQHAVEDHRHGAPVVPLLKLVQRYGIAARERALSEAADAIGTVRLS